MSVALAVTFLLSEQLIYEPFVVPRLPSWNEIPFYWHVIVFVPELIVCVAAALMLKGNNELVAFAIVGAILVTTVQWATAHLGSPGNIKTIEGGPLHFAVQALIMALLIGSALAIIRLVRFAVGRVNVAS